MSGQFQTRWQLNSEYLSKINTTAILVAMIAKAEYHRNTMDGANSYHGNP